MNKKYWTYDFFNDHLAKLSIKDIKMTIEGENPLMINCDARGIQFMIINYFEKLNER